jgi:hypothetical protein
MTWTNQTVWSYSDNVELCDQKRIDWQIKFPADTFHVLSLPIGGVIAKRGIHFFQGLYRIVSYVHGV